MLWGFCGDSGGSGPGDPHEFYTIRPKIQNVMILKKFVIFFFMALPVSFLPQKSAILIVIMLLPGPVLSLSFLWGIFKSCGDFVGILWGQKSGRRSRRRSYPITLILPISSRFVFSMT